MSSKRTPEQEERRRALRAAAPDHWRRWYQANRERQLVLMRANAASRVRDRGKENEERNERRRQNPEQRRTENALRRSVAAVPFTAAELAQKMAYWGNRCHMCGGPFEHLDHVKPLSKGGAHMLANLRPACASCNTRKGAKWAGAQNVRHAPTSTLS